MEIIAGKEVFTTLEEIVDPSHTALIVVDMQNDFCAAGGLWHGLGLDLSMVATVLPSIKRLISAARDARVSVIYIKMTNLPDLSSLSPTRIRHMVHKAKLSPDQIVCTIGSWGAEILPEIAPQVGDLVIQKWRHSAFDGTSLDQSLRSCGVQSVVVCGTTTSVCVEGTARDAFDHDYYTVAVTDCISDVRQDWHRASLLLMQSRVDQVGCNEIISAWETKPRRDHDVVIGTHSTPTR
jgi:nicotinamidase-related amidase